MSDTLLLILSKLVFGGSVILVIFLAYREYIITKLKAQRDELELGERINEDKVNNMSDSELVDSVNKELSDLPIPPTRPDKKE